jgi:hypothetical protein
MMTLTTRKGEKSNPMNYKSKEIKPKKSLEMAPHWE